MRRQWKWRLRTPLLVVLGICAALVTGVGPAAAATYTCTNSSADQAALQTLINAGGTITITGTCRGNWTVGTANVYIVAGAPAATLNGNATGTVLVIFGGKTATLVGLTITNGNSAFGGGIQVFGSTLKLESSKLTGNHATDYGGGIYAASTATVDLNQTTLTNNSAGSIGGGLFIGNSTLSTASSKLMANTASFAGGAAGFDDSSASFDSSRLAMNTAFEGGAIFASAGSSPDSVTLSNSSVDHNTLSGINGGGGGIINFSDGSDSSISLEHTAVSFNLALHGGRGGGIFNDGNLNSLASITATDSSTFLGNQASGAGGTIPGDGGAIYTEANGGPASVSLTNTTVGPTSGSLNGNKADYGGGIYNDAFNGLTTVNLNKGGNVTGNSASVTGGGIDNAGGLVSISGGVVLLNHPNNCVGC